LNSDSPAAAAAGADCGRRRLGASDSRASRLRPRDIRSCMEAVCCFAALRTI
jgi:hypothetical protein